MKKPCSSALTALSGCMCGPGQLDHLLIRALYLEFWPMTRLPQHLLLCVNGKMHLTLTLQAAISHHYGLYFFNHQSRSYLLFSALSRCLVPIRVKDEGLMIIPLFLQLFESHFLQFFSTILTQCFPLKVGHEGPLPPFTEHLIKPTGIK